MKKTIILLALYLLIAPALNAGQTNTSPQRPGSILQTGTENTVSRQVTGRGSNRDQAIKDALYRAIEQARGVRVDSGTYRLNYSGSSADFNTQTPGERSINLDALDFSTTGTVYTTEIGGLIKGYEVLEENKLDGNTYEVILNVEVYDYATRGLTSRVKVALMPVQTIQNSYKFLDQTISGETLSSLFTQRLTSGLTQTNKFAVLDRQSLRDFAGEKNILISLDAPLSEQAKLAETLGADYLLLGTVTQALIERIEKRLEAAQFTVTEYQARFHFNYRLVDSATKQIVLAADEQLYLENDEVRKLADEQDSTQWNSSQVRDAFLSVIANKVVEAIIDRVYPISIAAVQANGEIILDQGGDRMKQGMLLDVFAQGEELFDVDTNESLGSIENYIATIEIQRISANISYARVVQGDASKISTGLICRPKEAEAPVIESGSESEVIKTETGGVKLPFDR